MTRIVRRAVGDPITAEMREELKRIASMPDSKINTVDIPETMPEQFAAARRKRKALENKYRELAKAG